MKNLLIRWAALVASIVGASYLTNMVMPKGIEITPTFNGIMTLFVGAALLAVVNATLGKILKFISMPISCMTLGLFALVINAALFWAVGSLGMGYKVNSFWAALLGSLLVSAIGAVLHMFVPDEKKED